MRILDTDIPAPQPEPLTWRALVADCLGRVAEVRERLHATVDADRLLAAALLARLWRDVRVDCLERQRHYLPADVSDRHGLDLRLMQKALRLDRDRGCDGSALDASCNCANLPNTALRLVLPGFRDTMRELVERTGLLLADGADTISRQPQPLRATLRAEHVHSRAILHAVRARRYDTLSRRPEVGRLDHGWAWLRTRLGA